jgi:hypothetical protein
MRDCPRTRAYVERRTKEGLSKPEIIRCVKRYLAREVYPPPARSRCTPAGVFAAAPDALAPQQHDWTATGGQVAHPGGPAAMGLGPNATPTQPTTVAVVWTVSCHSPPTTSAASTSKPSRPSSLEADTLRC